MADRAIGISKPYGISWSVMAMTHKLLPCPFCKAEAMIVSSWKYATVKCTHCGALLPHMKYEDINYLVALWNGELTEPRKHKI